MTDNPIPAEDDDYFVLDDAGKPAKATQEETLAYMAEHGDLVVRTEIGEGAVIETSFTGVRWSDGKDGPTLFVTHSGIGDDREEVGYHATLEAAEQGHLAIVRASMRTVMRRRMEELQRDLLDFDQARGGGR